MRFIAQAASAPAPTIVAPIHRAGVSPSTNARELWQCEALSANPRLDTPTARAFLGNYVNLP